MNPDGEPESTVDVGRGARHHMHQVGAVGYGELARRGTGRLLQVVDGVGALARGGARVTGPAAFGPLRTGITPSQRFSPRSPARTTETPTPHQPTLRRLDPAHRRLRRLCWPGDQ